MYLRSGNARFTPKPLTIVVLLALLSISTVYAQERIVDDPPNRVPATKKISTHTPEHDIDSVVVEAQKPAGHVSGGKDGVYDDNLSSSFKDKQDIDTFRGTSAADVLQGMTGVYSGDARNSGAIDPNVRGIQGQGRVPVTVDGTEQGITVYRGYAGANNRNYIDPMLIGSIRVEKGPSLTRGMENSVGGGIAITTIGVNDVLKPGQEFGLDIRVEQGNGHVKPRTVNLNNYVGKPWVDSMDPYLDRYPLKMDWQGTPIPRQGSPAMLTAVEPKQVKFSSFGQDQAYRIAGAMHKENVDVLLAYAYRKRGNYFAGKGGAHRYENAFSSVTNLFGSGSEVTNTSNETQTLLFKSSLRPTMNQMIDVMVSRMESDYGDIMPSRIRGMQIYPADPNNPKTSGANILNALHLVPQWNLSSITLNTYALNYRWKPESRWIDFKTGIWISDASLHTQNSGHAPLGCLGSFGGSCTGKPLINLSAYNSDDKRYGLSLSNRMTLSDTLALTLAGSAQHQKMSSPDDWWRTQLYDGLRMMPQAGTRREYKLDVNVDWQPTERLSFSAGARYNSYWSNDDGLQALFDSDSPNKEFFKDGMVMTPMGWRLEFTGGKDTQGNPYDEFDPGYVDMLYDDSGKLHAANNPFMNGMAEKKGWVFSDSNLIFAGESKVDSNHRLDYNNTYSQKPVSLAIAKKTGHAWSPVFSVAYKLTDNVRVYARYAQATHMPSLFTTSFGFSGYTPLNTHYKPEKATNIEIGYAHDLRSLFTSTPDKADIKLAYYQNTIKDAIDRNLDLRFSQLDQWKTAGLELQARYDDGRFFSELGLARRLKHEVCDDHSAVMRNMGAQFDPHHKTPSCVADGFNVGYTQNMQQPLWTADMTVGGRFFNRKLEAGTRVHYHSGYKRAPVYHVLGETDTYSSPLLWHGVTLVDAFARYHFKNDFSMELSGLNLTNRHYIDPLSRSPMPAPGRIIKLSMVKKF